MNIRRLITQKDLFINNLFNPARYSANGHVFPFFLRMDSVFMWCRTTR